VALAIGQEAVAPPPTLPVKVLRQPTRICLDALRSPPQNVLAAAKSERFEKQESSLPESMPLTAMGDVAKIEGAVRRTPMEVSDCVAGLRKVKINWDLLRSFDPTPLLTLEQELEEAVRQEYEARRLTYLARKKEQKRKRRRGAAAATSEETATMAL